MCLYVHLFNFLYFIKILRNKTVHPVNIYNSNCYSLDTSEWTYKEISIGIGAEKESNKSLPEALRTQFIDEFVRHQPLICKLHSIVYGDSIRYDYEYDFNLLFHVQNCGSYDYHSFGSKLDCYWRFETN